MDNIGQWYRRGPDGVIDVKRHTDAVSLGVEMSFTGLVGNDESVASAVAAT